MAHAEPLYWQEHPQRPRHAPWPVRGPAWPGSDREVEPDPETWLDGAACKGQTQLFFPPRAERPQARTRREAQARLLCGGCPVQSQCRHFARNNREYGLWGGESEEERHLAGYTVAAPIGVRARAASCA